jgi:hypothetical protein
MDTPNCTVAIQLAVFAAMVIIYQQTVRTPVISHLKALSALAITHQITKDVPSIRTYKEKKKKSKIK